mmetsp:Transcript_2671/g.6427  ORF Transcript_2671/g.6427 Transcript_2671/m.6427 type:complete len:762 (+) Transcript_2671:171-2456(+)
MPESSLSPAPGELQASMSTTSPSHILGSKLSSQEQALRVTHTPLLTGTSVEEKRAEVLQYFLATFDLYERLYEPVKPDAFYQTADPLRHPLVFYLGHTAVFYVNKLAMAGLLPERFNPLFESIFAVGVDEMSWDDLIPPKEGWPKLNEVFEYRAQVKKLVVDVISSISFSLPITWESPFWAILMGIEHERIHLETSSVLIRQLPLNAFKPEWLDAPFWNVCPAQASQAPTNDLLPVINNDTEVCLGKDHATATTYGWDVEYGKATSTVAPFKASKFLVTNAEFLEFVQGGGYSAHELWTEEGQKWVRFRQAAVGAGQQVYPIFWVVSASGSNTVYRLRTMLKEIPMPWSWPVEVNYLEAKAFCNWKSRKTNRSIRLPMEDEYAVLRNTLPGDHTDWEFAPGNLNLEYFASSSPVDFFPPTKGGFYDVVGNVWQHTETPVDAFEGFKVHDYYEDFSVPTFDLMHNVIVGGSWISTGNEALKCARYAFRRHFFQHAGFRYIETSRKVSIRNDSYERDSLVNAYLHFHYSKEAPFGVPNFCVALAEHIIAATTEQEKKVGRAFVKACDLGCATGRLTFELCRKFEKCIGLDFSARFIRKAVALQTEGKVSYLMSEEGDIVSSHTILVDDLGPHARDRASFYQADACNLDPRYSDFDVLIGINLIDRLSHPAKFLATAAARVKKGGLLFIASPYTWLEEYTPKERWLGGYVDAAGKEVSTLDGLKAHLEPHFRMLKDPIDVPFVIRETRRKHQHTLSQLSIWERV